MEIYKMNQKELAEFEKLKGDWSYIGQALNWISVERSNEFHERLFDNMSIEKDNKEQLAFANAFLGISEIEVVKEESNSEILYKYLKSQYTCNNVDSGYPILILNKFTRDIDDGKLDKKVYNAYQSLTTSQELEVLSKFVEYVKERINE